MTGTVVFSVDAELSWGVHDMYPLTDAQKQRYDTARENWFELLRLFEAFDVPATWAVVGHLLSNADRYREDHPCSNGYFATADSGIESEPQKWLGTDLLEAVEAATVDNEIGSHSYSHAVFSDISEEVARSECELARALGHEHGLDLTSFVFPRNRIGHRSSLASAGFTCYRGRRPSPAVPLPGYQGGRMLVGGLTGAVAPPTVMPAVDEYGLVNIPASLFLGGFRGRLWSALETFGSDPAVSLAKSGIEAACKRGELFHMWLHPHDLTDECYVDRVKNILDYVDLKAAENEVQIRTMGEVARLVRTEEWPNENRPAGESRLSHSSADSVR